MINWLADLYNELANKLATATLRDRRSANTTMQMDESLPKTIPKHLIHLWILLGFALTALGLGVAYSLYVDHGTIESAEKSRLAHQASIVNANLSPQLQKSSDSLQALRDELPRVLSAPDGVERVSQRLKTMASAMAGVRTLTFTDARGKIIAANREELIGTQVSDQQRFKTIKASGDPDRLYVTTPFKTPLGIYTFALARVLTDKHGEFDGYLMAIIDPEYVMTLLKSTLYAPDMRVNLVHGQGQIIYREPDPESSVGINLAEHPDSFIKRHLNSGRPVSLLEGGTTAMTGEKRIGAIQTIWPLSVKADQPLVVVQGRALSAIFEGWKREVQIRLGLFLALTAVSILGLLFYQRRLLAEEQQRIERDQEREAANEKLTRSEAQYRLLAENSTDCTFWLGKDGRYRYMAPSSSELFGYPPESFITDERLMIQLIHPDDRAQYQRHLEDSHATDMGDLEFRVIDRHGNERWIAHHCEPMMGAGGEYLGRRGTHRDITLRKHAMDALRESQERLQLLIDHAPASLAMFDTDMRYLAVSRRWRCDYYLGEQEIIGRSHYEIFPEITDVWKEIHQRGLSGEVIRSEDDPFERLDGTVQWLRWEVRPWHTSGNGIGGIVIFSEDITERKNAELRLQESEVRYREMFETNPHPMYVFDAETLKILAVNDAMVKQYGYGHQEFLGMSALDLRPADDVSTLQKTVARHKAGGDVTEDIWRDRCKDGREIWVEIAAHPISFTGRKAVVVSVHDVTKRINTEQEILKLSKAVEQSPDSVIITDLDGRIEYVNDAFVRITGYAKEEAIGRSPKMLQSGKTPVQTYQSLWQALSNGWPWQGEFYNTRKDGSEYVDWAIITPLKQPDGLITNYVAVQEDITERKRQGRELDQHRYHLEKLVEDRTAALVDAKLEAETANLAKSTFLANMSHEIRTPMNGVLGMATLLRRTELTPKQINYLGKIESSGKHLLSIINDILDLSKIEAGKLNLDEQDFTLPDLFRDVTAIVEDKISAKGLDYRIDAETMPQQLHGDPTRLAQALVNFLSNAVKFTEKGGITLRCHKLNSDQRGYLLRFEVTDTGIGIASDKLSRLFEPFEQAEKSTSREYGGTGLGLAITKRIAQMMGGEVGVTSEFGKGSSFWLTVQLGRCDDEAVSPVRGTGTPEELIQQRHSGKRILLAEDNFINQEVAQSLLRDVGLLVDTANNGAEAMALLADHDYDLILMDMRMPVMDGTETTRAIRQQPRYDKVPIVAVTANAFGDDRERCLAAGMDDFIAKPFVPDQLFETILTWLDRNKAPIQHVTQWKSGGIVVRYVGTVTDHDFAEVIATFQADPRYGGVRYIIHDFEGSDHLVFSHEAIEHIAGRDAAAALSTPIHKVAAVADRDDVRSFVDTYLNTGLQSAECFRLFPTMAVAQAWIDGD